MSTLNIFDGLTTLLQPSLSVIALTSALALLLPLLLHLLIYRSSTNTSLPSFILVGPSGAGKTSLQIKFERGKDVKTHTSQSPLEVEVSLPVKTKAASSRYRSVNDPSLQAHKVFLIIDTPGHSKLRHHALQRIAKPQNLHGIIFLVDAANISPGSSELRATAEYLHDVLLLLQKRYSASSSARGSLPLLIAANKLDLFTALPVPLVQEALEDELTRVRESRGKGLLDSGTGLNDTGISDENDWLGVGGEGKFQLSHMEEFGIEVKIEGGATIAPGGADIDRWWQWMGSYL